MAVNLDDPRVRKTRKGMRQAFFTLLEKQGYDSITVQDIADQAEIARVTFYRHYRDKEELLADCLDSLFDEIIQQSGIEKNYEAVSADAPTRLLFEYLEDHEKLYKILLASRGGEAAIARLRNYLVEKIVDTFSLISRGNRPNIPDKLIAYHWVSAQIGLGIWWVENDKPYSIDYMIETANWLSLAGGYRALGYDDFDLPAPKRG